jgi:hypothetical protein
MKKFEPKYRAFVNGKMIYEKEENHDLDDVIRKYNFKCSLGNYGFGDPGHTIMDSAYPIKDNQGATVFRLDIIKIQNECFVVDIDLDLYLFVTNKGVLLSDCSDFKIIGNLCESPELFFEQDQA